MHPPHEVVILIVACNGRDLLPSCLGSILDSTQQARLRIVIVDNASSDGTAELVREQFPEVTLLESPANLGFAGGNNFGFEWIHCNCPDVPFVCLLNQDTVVEPGWLAPLVQFLTEHPEAAAVQPRIHLCPQTELINTLGTTCHFLGFGYCTGLGEAASEHCVQPRRIDAVSGAAVLVRSELAVADGLFLPELRMYLEDVDLSWRLRLSGYELFVVPESVVYHRYSGDAHARHYFYLERNRWVLLLTFYRLRTLLLLAPALCLMEFGQWLFAAGRSLLFERVQVYRYLLDPRTLVWICRRRAAIQQKRKLDDRRWMSSFVGRIQSPLLKGPMVRYVANPVFGAYWSVAKRLLLW